MRVPSQIITRALVPVAGVLLAAGPARAATQYYDNVVIVLDASGSMRAEMPGGKIKMAAAKQALKTVLSKVPPTTHVGLLVLPKGGWVYPLGPRDNQKLAKAISKIKPRGKTPLAEHMKMAADRLLEERTRQFGYGGYRLLVVTDGEHTGGEGLIERHTPDIVQRGIVLDVIGVAMESEHALAQYAHSYRRADDPKSLRRAITEVFAEISAKEDGVAGGEIFALLEGLEPEVATQMIEAFSVMANHPIGEAAPSPEPVKPPPAPSTQPKAPVKPVPASPPPAAEPTPSCGSCQVARSRSQVPSPATLLAACVAAWFLARSRRRGGHATDSRGVR